MRVATFCIWMSIAAETAAGGSSLSIRVLDQVGIPDAVYGEAVSVARGIFQEAGIETQWRICHLPAHEGACEQVGLAEVLVKAVMGNASGVGSPIFGAAVRYRGNGLFAYLFWRNVRDTASRYVVSPGALLGIVLAHEVGHLLGLEHCLTGVMRGDLRAIDVRQALAGGLAFNRGEARRLERTARSRSEVTN